MVVCFKAWSSTYVMTWCFIKITNAWTTQEKVCFFEKMEKINTFSLNYLFTSCGGLRWGRNFICFCRTQSGMPEKWNNIYHYHLFLILLFGEKLREGKTRNEKFSRISSSRMFIFQMIFVWFWVNKKFRCRMKYYATRLWWR